MLKMIFKFLINCLIFGSYGISASIVLEAKPISVISVPTLNWDDIKGHSYLRLVTASGNIYHFTDEKGIVKEVRNATDISELPFLTVRDLSGSEHYIYAHTNGTGYQVITSQNTNKTILPHQLSLYQFAGVDKKRYTVVLNAFSGIVLKVLPMFNEVPADGIEFRITYDKQIFAFTFTEDGSDLIDIVNCTNTKLVTRQHGNAYNSSLPYITFANIDGQWYDIFFPANGTEDSLPFLMRNRSEPANKCGKGMILRKFKGPDNNQYDLEFDWTLDGEGKHYFKVGYNYIGGDIDASNFLLGDGVTEIYRIADDDELELLGVYFIP